MKFYDGIDLASEDAHIDLTPLIDVIFMLVIFFILTMSFTHPVIDIKLPESKSAQAIKDTQFIDISVNQKGEYLYENNQISLEKVKNLLDENTTRELNIIADEQSPFDAFIKLIDIAKEKRAGKFLITADKARDEK